MSPPLRNPQHIFTDLPQGSGNPYLTRITQDSDVAQHILLWGSQLRDRQGSWRQWFQQKTSHHLMTPTPNSQPSHPHLIVEIGCHLGDVLSKMTAHHSKCMFIGIDITLKRVYLSAQKLLHQHASNGCVLYFNAKHIKHLFASHEIDTTVIFFPDPWNKKQRQKKHRLLQWGFIADLYELTSPDGYIWLKTDCQDYFESTAENLEKIGFRATHQPHPILNSDPSCDPYISSFERRYTHQNKPIYQQVFQKSSVQTADPC